MLVPQDYAIMRTRKKRTIGFLAHYFAFGTERIILGHNLCFSEY